MKIGDYKLKLTIKAMCLFEQLTGKSFLAVQDDDLIDVLYAMFITSNNLKITKKAFEVLLEDRKVAKWMIDEYTRQSDFDNQLAFFNQKIEEGDQEEGEKQEPVTISELAGAFVSKGIDPRYVMYEMELWEMQMYRTAIELDNRERLEEDRMWTWFTILPHLDKKSASKLKSPSDLLPFPWDKDKKDLKERELEKNTKAAFSFLQAQAKKEEKEEDGEQ